MQAILLASVFNLLGIVTVPSDVMVEVVGRAGRRGDLEPRDLVKESATTASPPDEGSPRWLPCSAIRGAQRELEAAYYGGMVGLLGVENRTERITGRELYRRFSRIGEAVVDVAERVVYAVVKET